jgi:hypothetical protein
MVSNQFQLVLENTEEKLSFVLIELFESKTLEFFGGIFRSSISSTFPNPKEVSY